MNTTGLVGNAHLHAGLSGPLTHAYLLSGPQAACCRALAEIMARSLVCQSPEERPCNACPACEKAAKGIHPDIAVTVPGESGAKREIAVSQIREITRDAHTLPNEADHKVYIVEEADTLNANAQNAFLKVLEEPPSFVTFLLLAENPLRLLPTVRSRCTHLALAPTEGESPEGEGPHLSLVEDFLEAFPGEKQTLLAFCVSLEKTDKKVLEAFIKTCHTGLMEALIQGNPAPELFPAIDLFESLQRDLRFNVSAGHISGKLAATLL